MDYSVEDNYGSVKEIQDSNVLFQRSIILVFFEIQTQDNLNSSRLDLGEAKVGDRYLFLERKPREAAHGWGIC